jgi:cytochrome c553
VSAAVWMVRAAASLSATLALVTGPAVAGDAAQGKRKAMSCQACHGAQGLSMRDDAPSIAGQSEFYLLKALREFREGKRENEMMSVVARTLTDDEIGDLAAYFSSFRIEVVKPKP